MSDINRLIALGGVQQPDYSDLGNAFVKRREEQAQKNALQQIFASPDPERAALESGNAELAREIATYNTAKTQRGEADKKAKMEQAKTAWQAAQWADTPEKWAQAQSYLSQNFGTDLSGVGFDQREKIVGMGNQMFRDNAPVKLGKDDALVSPFGGGNPILNPNAALDRTEDARQADQTIGFNREQLGETGRHNRATEGLTARGQNLTNARAANDGYRLMTTEEKKAAGLPTESAYQVNGNGQITRVAGNTSVRPIPSSALSGIQSNRRTLSKIDAAISALKKNPNAIGLKTYAGDMITQRMDPGGVNVRALVADVGSQKLHDRSGAAVTLSEAPRLTPFIPSVHDRADVAIQKLQNLRAEYETSVDEAEAFYSPEAGYMSLPTRDGKKPGSSGGKPVNAGVIDFNDLP